VQRPSGQMDTHRCQQLRVSEHWTIGRRSRLCLRRLDSTDHDQQSVEPTLFIRATISLSTSRTHALTHSHTHTHTHFYNQDNVDCLSPGNIQKETLSAWLYNLSHHWAHSANAGCCYSCRTFCGLSVCQLGTPVCPAKTDEPIGRPFRMWTDVGQRNHVLDKVLIVANWQRRWDRCLWRWRCRHRYYYHSWWRGVVVNGVRRMNEVNARRARLVAYSDG